MPHEGGLASQPHCYSCRLTVYPGLSLLVRACQVLRKGPKPYAIDCVMAYLASSSRYLAISTSLIHCFVRRGSADFDHPSVSKLTFPALKFHRVKKLCQMQFRKKNSRIIHHTTVRISSTVRFNMPLLLRKRGSGIDEFCGSRLISLSGLLVFPVLSGLNS